MRDRRSTLWGILLLTSVLAACTTGRVSPSSMPAATRTTATSPAMPTSTAVPVTPNPSPTTLAPTVETLQEGIISAEGPWLAYYDFDAKRLIVIDEDGQAWQSFEVPEPDNNAFFPAPEGGHLAYVSRNAYLPDPDYGLIILQLPAGDVTHRVQLFGPTWAEQIAAQDPEDTGYIMDIDVIQSLGGEGAVAWSSDGDKVAFTGAIEGPSSDVYLLDLSTGGIKRMTSGPLQAYELNWSPDDAWIVHLAVRAFGTGAGWSVDTLWAAASNGSTVLKLSDNARMTFVEAWQSDTQFLATEWGADFGPQNLLRFSIEARSLDMLFEGPLLALAFDDDAGTAALFKDPSTAAYFGYVPGLYVLDLTTGEQFIVEPEEDVPNALVWVNGIEAYAAAFDRRTLLFDRAGFVRLELLRGGLLAPSPDGSMLGIYGDTRRGEPGLALFTPSGEERLQPASEPVSMMTWAPDSQTVFYESGQILYVLHIDAMETRPVKMDVPDWSGAYYWIPAP